ncbi:MAG: hypothetical protein JW862_15260 [Anaerolineales bacterium]|nr:hypothetical protein [Anaerolineales bacterium]
MPDPQPLLPWQANRTLTQAERASVARLISQDDQLQAQLHNLELLEQAVQAQPQIQPPTYIRQQILESVQPVRGRVFFAQWAGGLLLAVLTLVLLWGLVQPGITLRWTASGEEITAFRVYRLDPQDLHYELVDEVPANTRRSEYRVLDSVVLPSRNIEYVIEGVDQNGYTLKQQSTVGAALPTLISQLTLILSSLVAASAVVLLVTRADWQISWPKMQLSH